MPDAFRISDWTGIRARIRKHADGLWHVALVRGRTVIVYDATMPCLTWSYALAGALRIMRAALETCDV